MGTGLLSAFILAAVLVLFTDETTSPGLAVPEASTEPAVLVFEGGLKGVGPDVFPDCSQGLGGMPPTAAAN